MSPVSPVLHTAAIVRIGLNTQSEWEHPFHKIRCLFRPDYFHFKVNSQRCLSLFIWEQEWIRGEFQTKLLGLI